MLGLKKTLCIGRYRYHFIIDGVEKVNHFASQAVDPRSGQRTVLVSTDPAAGMYVCMNVCACGAAGKLCNIVVVSSAPRKFNVPSSQEGPTQLTSLYEVRVAQYITHTLVN